MFFELRFYRPVEYVIEYIYNCFQNFLKLRNVIFKFLKIVAYM
jgi:hypothetical protein